MEVRYLIQVTKSLIFTNLEISIFCTVQEPSWHLISYESKNIFIFSLFYDPFYCNMICFTAVFKIITAVATWSYWLPIFSLCFCSEPREGKHVSVRPNSTPHPLSIIAKLKNKVLSKINFCSFLAWTHQLSIYSFAVMTWSLC